MGRTGRPRLDAAAPAERSISVRVTVEQQRELRKVAAENRTRVSSVIREAVDEYVSDYRESGGVFRRRRR